MGLSLCHPLNIGREDWNKRYSLPPPFQKPLWLWTSERLIREAVQGCVRRQQKPTPHRPLAFLPSKSDSDVSDPKLGRADGEQEPGVLKENKE